MCRRGSSILGAETWNNKCPCQSDLLLTYLCFAEVDSGKLRIGSCAMDPVSPPPFSLREGFFALFSFAIISIAIRVFTQGNTTFVGFVLANNEVGSSQSPSFVLTRGSPVGF